MMTMTNVKMTMVMMTAVIMMTPIVSKLVQTSLFLI